VKPRVSALCVGLSSECDPPGAEAEVVRFMVRHLPGAKGLPFVAFVTADMERVHGYSGGRDAAAFLKELELAEKSPLRKATPEVAATLETLLAEAERAAAKDDWKAVVAAARAAGATVGACAARDAIAALRERAASVADMRLDGVVDALRNGGDLAASKKTLARVASDFEGEPAGGEAEKGLIALSRHAAAESARAAGDAGKLAALRQKALEEFRGTRWEALFLEE